MIGGFVKNLKVYNSSILFIWQVNTIRNSGLVSTRPRRLHYHQKYRCGITGAVVALRRGKRRCVSPCYCQKYRQAYGIEIYGFLTQLGPIKAERHERDIIQSESLFSSLIRISWRRWVIHARVEERGQLDWCPFAGGVAGAGWQVSRCLIIWIRISPMP